MIFPSLVDTPVNSPALLRDFEKIFRQTDLPGIHFHHLRHAAASLLLSQGVPSLVVSKIQDHSKPSTTLDIHALLIPIIKDSVAQTMDGLHTLIPAEVDQSKPAPASPA